MKRLIVSAAVCLCFLAFGADRIAVVDLERVFKEYYKSRIAEDEIKRQAESYRNYLTKLNLQFEELRNSSQKARLDSLNTALSEDVRKNAEKSAESQQMRMNELKAEIEQYIAGRSADMRDLEKKKRDEIMQDIRSEIRRRANAEGYGFVLDVSGQTTNEQPAVMYYPSSADITDAVIREINRGASKKTTVKETEK